MEKIYFSIIIVTYNRAHLIKRAINSILNQDFTSFELLIEDDGSTDNTEEIVRSFNNDQIFYYKDKQNRGSFTAKNRAVKRVKGQYIMFLDSDDEFLPGALHIIAKRIKEEKENYKQFSFLQKTYSKNGIKMPPKYFMENVKEISYYDSLLGKYNDIYTQNVISSEIKESIVFEETLIGGYLSLLWLDLKRKFGPSRINPDIVKIYHRDNEDTITKALTKNIKKIIKNRAIQSSLFLQKFGEDMLKINSPRYTFESLRAAENFLLLKEPEKARTFLSELIINKKANLKTYLYLIICFLLNLIYKNSREK